MVAQLDLQVDRVIDQSQAWTVATDAQLQGCSRKRQHLHGCQMSVMSQKATAGDSEPCRGDSGAKLLGGHEGQAFSCQKTFWKA